MGEGEEAARKGTLLTKRLAEVIVGRRQREIYRLIDGVCVCVCVCVFVRERERESDPLLIHRADAHAPRGGSSSFLFLPRRERQSDREGGREGERERDSQRDSGSLSERENLFMRLAVATPPSQSTSSVGVRLGSL